MGEFSLPKMNGGQVERSSCFVVISSGKAFSFIVGFTIPKLAAGIIYVI